MHVKQEQIEAESHFNIDRSKRKVIYYGTSDKLSRGVPVVINNTRKALEETGNYQTFQLINGWVSDKYILEDNEGQRVVYHGKEELLAGLKRLGHDSTDWLDILHFHSFNISDHFHHYGGSHNQSSLSLDEFLAQLPSTKTVFTSHGNPSIDLARIRETFGEDYESLTEEQRYTFLERHRIKERPSKTQMRERAAAWDLMALKSTEQMIDSVDQATFVSDYQRKRYMDNFFSGANPKREPTTILNGPELSAYLKSPDLEAITKKLRSEYNIRDDIPTLLFIGGISEDKGVYDLARAVKRLNDEDTIGKKVQVIYVGDQTRESEARFKSIFEDDLNNVILTGYVGDRKKIAGFYNLADITIQPTHGECFNQIAAESLTANTPVLIGNSAGPRDIYVDKGLAFGHKPKDSADLYRQLVYMLTHPEEVERVTRRGNIFVTHNLDYKVMAANYDKLYTSLLDGSAALVSVTTINSIVSSSTSHESYADTTSNVRSTASPDTIKSRGNTNNEISLDPSKTNVLLMGTNRGSTHGVPIVMENIANGLANNSNYGVFYLTNDLDNPKIQLYNPSGQMWEFEGREDLIAFLENQGLLDCFDVLHTHSWHFSDHYPRYLEMPIQEFFDKFQGSRVIYTDHSNPSEERITIDENFGLDYSSLSAHEKKAWVDGNAITARAQDWDQRWIATMLKCKSQMLEIADQVVHVSRSQRDETREMMPYTKTKNKPVVIYNGCDMSQYTTDDSVERRAENLRTEIAPGNEKLILYVGRITPHKGADDLAAVVSVLQSAQDIGNFKVLYIGSDNIDGNNCSADTMSRLLRMSGGNHITFYDPVDDREELAAFYKLADVVVQPTWGECFNQTCGESLAMGTPVVASRVSGPQEVYVDQGVAVGHNPRDVSDLAKQIASVLRAPGEHNEQALRGQRYVTETLSIQKMVQRYAKLYSA